MLYFKNQIKLKRGENVDHPVKYIYIYDLYRVKTYVTRLFGPFLLWQCVSDMLVSIFTCGQY